LNVPPWFHRAELRSKPFMGSWRLFFPTLAIEINREDGARKIVVCYRS